MKKIRVVILILFLIFLFIFCKNIKKDIEIEQYNWNNGYCELDGGRLIYDSVSSKYHYKCEICGKEYLFDKLMNYK